MMGLLRALGSAVIVGAGVKAGGDIYSALRKRFTGEEGEERSPVDEILEADADDADRRARLEAERERIEEELARLKKRAKKRKKKESAA